MRRSLQYLLLVAVLGVGFLGIFIYAERETQEALSLQQKSFDSKITTLQKQIAVLQETVSAVSGESRQVALSLSEVKNRETARSQTQDEILTGAVAKVAPSVVSIVIAKDVPDLEVVYQNPFGDDPFFKDFGFQIPVYRQKGTVRKQVGAGTGFIVTPQGHILTNRHVVEDASASYTVLLSDGKNMPAKVLYKDTANDLAILKIDGGGYKAVSLGDSGNLKLGQTVIAVGNALGEYNNSVSIGIISGLNRNITAGGSGGSVSLADVIQTDAAINPGNSGGPLFDTEGKVVGVNVATVVGSSNISFAIPVNVAKSILDKI